MSTAQHSTAQHSTAQHSTALISSIGLFFQCFKYPFNLLPSSSKLPSNSNLNTDSNLTAFKLKSINESLLKSLVNTIRLSFVVASVLFLTAINSANAALTATTANVIQGTAPWFAATSGNTRLDFTVGGTYYSETDGNIATGTVKDFNAGLTLSDFVVKALTASDFTASSDYADSDDDGAHPTAAFTVGATTYEWRDSVGLIPPSYYGKSLNCGSGLSLPLTLKITLSNVLVHSEYGLLKDSTAIPLEKIYQITSTSGICYAKPNQITVNSTATWLGVNAAGVGQGWNTTSYTTPHAQNGGGYSNDFVPNQGFKASASTKFPTTGFPKAKFQLVMTGLQTDYNYTVQVNPGGGVSVDSDGYVTLNSKPTGTGYVTVTATLKTDSTVHHDYTFNPTTV